MKRSRTSLVSAAAAALVLLAPGAARASGSSSMPRSPQMPTASPEQEAIEYYNDGISYSDKATALEKGSRRGDGPEEEESSKPRRRTSTTPRSRSSSTRRGGTRSVSA